MIDRIKFNDQLLNPYGKELVVQIIDIFFSEYGERFENLKHNIANKEFDQLKFNAHSFKGVVGNFMDPTVSGLSQTLDAMARERHESGLEQVYADLEKSTMNLIEQLKAIREELTS